MLFPLILLDVYSLTHLWLLQREFNTDRSTCQRQKEMFLAMSLRLEYIQCKHKVLKDFTEDWFLQ